MRFFLASSPSSSSSSVPALLGLRFFAPAVDFLPAAAASFPCPKLGEMDKLGLWESRPSCIGGGGGRFEVEAKGG